MSRASTFHQRDVEKALKAASRHAGSAVVVDLKAGTIRIELNGAPAPATPVTALDAWRAMQKAAKA